MCDTVISCAREHLLPLARDHLLPLLKEAVNIIRGVPTEIAEMKDELERIEGFINEADRMADSQEDNTSLKMRANIKQLIEASFHIEDVIDEYLIREEQQLPDPGCAAVANYVKTKILCLHIAYKIQNIKSQIAEIKDKFEKDHGFPIHSWEIGSSSSTETPNAALLHNLREAPFYMEETDVVGFEEPRGIMIDWLVKGRAERTIVSLVGMGGQGKTTLAKRVFDNTEVVNHFDCHAWITVSPSYNIENLLKDILCQFYKQQGVDLPQGIQQMDRKSLVDEVRNYLLKKRYVVVFDDVWNINFWGDIEFAMIDKKNGSKVLITTRNINVANACKRSSFVEVLELKSLNDDQSIELFNKKAFHDLNGYCPENLKDISSKIIEKCKGLPLAIVVIGGLLSQKDRNKFEWDQFIEHVNSELNRDSRINRILSLSYHDLSYNLKPCLLYFGMYPEDYKVNAKMLIRQWIAEGFVKDDKVHTLEEVAEGYLKELIHRSLVQVVSKRIDGRAESCRVHDLVHAMILEKCEDLSFCKNISDDDQSSSSAIVRRLSIASDSDNLVESIESSKVRSLFVFTSKTIPQSLVKTILSKYRMLKVLAIEQDGLLEVPKDLERLIQLKYISVKHISPFNFESSKSTFGMLQNLETLCLGKVRKYTMPKEICKLTKLRHFLGKKMSLIGLKDGIGDMTSLQTLTNVYLDEDEDEDDNRVVELIHELGKLKQLKELSVSGVRNKYMTALSSSINQMQQLEELAIQGKLENPIIIDLHLNSPPPLLRYLLLGGKLGKLPEWIPKLQNLVMLHLYESELMKDAMKLLKSMPNLLSLLLANNAYKDKNLHFEDGSFKNLIELDLFGLQHLNNILIDKGALPSLKKLRVAFIPNLKMVPNNNKHLKKLQVLYMREMSEEFMKSITLQEGKEHWIFKHATLT